MKKPKRKAKVLEFTAPRHFQVGHRGWDNLADLLSERKSVETMVTGTTEVYKTLHAETGEDITPELYRMYLKCEWWNEELKLIEARVLELQPPQE